MDESKPKRKLSEQQKKAMAEGKRRAKEKRERERAEKLKADEVNRLVEYEKKKQEEQERRKREHEAELYQADLLKNLEKDRANKAKLKANFEKIKKSILNDEPRPDEEEEPVTDVKPLKIDEKKKEDLEKHPVSSDNTCRVSEDDIKTYVDRVSEIAQGIPDDQTRELFKEVCSVYDFEKDLSQNIGLLMSRANDVIKTNAEHIRRRVTAQRQNEIAENENRKLQEKKAKIKAARDRLSTLMML